MDNHRLTKKLHKWKTIGSKTVSRPTVKWEDDVIKRSEEHGSDKPEGGRRFEGMEEDY